MILSVRVWYLFQPIDKLIAEQHLIIISCLLIKIEFLTAVGRTDCTVYKLGDVLVHQSGVRCITDSHLKDNRAHTQEEVELLNLLIRNLIVSDTDVKGFLTAQGKAHKIILSGFLREHIFDAFLNDG